MEVSVVEEEQPEIIKTTAASMPDTPYKIPTNFRFFTNFLLNSINISCYGVVVF